MNAPKKAVGLLSSGLDSSVAIRMAQLSGVEMCLALSFDYGQRAASKELEHGARIAEKFQIRHRSLPLPWFRQLKTKSALLRESVLPRPTLSELGDSGFVKQSAKAVWVPNRNGVLIEIAAGFAEDIGADAVIVGFNMEEAATFPDNTETYLEKLSDALYYSTANHVRVYSPTSKMQKHEIVKKAVELDFPFPLLWSCYTYGEAMCGQCESCVRLKRALTHNKVALNGLFTDISL